MQHLATDELECVEARVAGIPCCVKLRYSPPSRAPRDEYGKPKEPDELECYFVERILDRGFSPAPWLERKLTSTRVRDQLEQELSASLSERHGRLMLVVT